MYRGPTLCSLPGTLDSPLHLFADPSQLIPEMFAAFALCSGPWGHEVNSPPLLFSCSSVCGRGGGSFRMPLGQAVPLRITERCPLGADILLGKQKLGWISAPTYPLNLNLCAVSNLPNCTW